MDTEIHSSDAPAGSWKIFAGRAICQFVSWSSIPQQNMPTSAATMKKSNSVKYSRMADMACSSSFSSG
jgi:hypothetical protein